MSDKKDLNIGTAGERSVMIGKSANQSVIVTGDANVVNVTYQGTQIAIPSPEAVAAHRAALKKQLQDSAYERWGGMSVYIHETGAALPIEASPYQSGRLGAKEQLLDALRQANRLLVLGGPGSGKTVSLERLAWELCGATDVIVPVWIRLFRYDGVPLVEWVRAHLQETGHLRLDDEKAVAAFLKEGSTNCFFLFDGLNEVRPDYRDMLAGELARWMAAYPNHPLILTSRPQDELWRRLRDKMNRAMVVQPIADDQARDYLVAHLAKKGEALYAQLDKRLREMARTPLILWLIKEAGEAGESIPGNRGELYARFVSRMLRRDTDRRMDAEIPERVKRRALAYLSNYLSLRKQLSCRRDEAVQVVAQHLDEKLAEAALGACARHGLLVGDKTIWFAPHQTIQEYFAALALWERIKREWSLSRWEHLKQRIQRLLTSEGNGWAALAVDDWWMETFVQLAGIVDDSDRLAQDVVRVNPWLAWWCVEEGRDVTEETREIVAKRSIKLLESGRVADRRRAVAALAHIRNQRTIEPLFRAVVDADIEVAGVAAQALIDMGKGVREKALTLAQKPKHPLYRSGLAYLQTVLSMPVVWVPPGSFLMGSDEKKDSQAYDDELPQHKVVLPGYWIGRYPVTVAQFKAFIEESGHKIDDADILRDPDNHPVRYITWHDAVAYCRWLSEKTDLLVRLPSEAEWEKAARGPDGRIYPWGNNAPSANLCNFKYNVGKTTPVGKYSPNGDSPYGCADMSGNVWEWTRTIWDTKKFSYPYDSKDGREDLEAAGDVLRVLRGGAFDGNSRRVRCACRVRVDPYNRSYSSGFRVVASSRNERSE